MKIKANRRSPPRFSRSSTVNRRSFFVLPQFTLVLGPSYSPTSHSLIQQTKNQNALQDYYRRCGVRHRCRRVRPTNVLGEFEVQCGDGRIVFLTRDQTACFEKYEVDSEGCLCKDALGSVVSSCIDSGCSSSNATAYSAWLASYCNEAPVSSNTWAVPSSTYAIPSSSAIPVYSAPPAYSTPVSSAPVPASYPVESYSTPVASEPAGYTSICTESTTLIWRSSTAVVPVTITHVPGGGWATYPAGNATSPVTATGSWPPAYSGPPATGGAARLGAGLAVVGAGVAAILL